MKKQIIHADAIEWLNTNELKDVSIITSLPDISEFPKLTITAWKNWFIETAKLVMTKCSSEGITIFYQSDIKRDGIWIDKSFLLQQAAEQIHQTLIMHKIVCRVPAGINTQTKVGYSHLLCFSQAPNPTLIKSCTDVLPEAGETTWERGMGINVCKLACEMVKNHTVTRTILDPFCGHGGVLEVANQLGLNAIGIDHKLKNTLIAQNFSVQF
ncbi:MAG: SAM-dependent methyltransferase [Bdellovibrionota bacterium]